MLSIQFVVNVSRCVQAAVALERLPWPASPEIRVDVPTFLRALDRAGLTIISKPDGTHANKIPKIINGTCQEIDAEEADQAGNDFKARFKEAHASAEAQSPFGYRPARDHSDVGTERAQELMARCMERIFAAA